MISAVGGSTAFRSDLQVAMEQVRQKSGNLLSWPEIMKEAKIVLMEKRTAVDAEESSQVTMFYEKLRSNVPVESTHDLLIRLEDISNRCSPGSTGNCFITSEYFFVEIVLAEDAAAIQVLVTHGESQAAEESVSLRNIINSRQWELLERNLKGLSDIYIDTADRQVKKAAFAFLNNLEAYLLQQNPNVDSVRGLSICSLMMAPFSYFVRREAGIPSRIYYFCPPSAITNAMGEHVTEISFTDMLTSAGVRYVEVLMQSTTETQLLEIGTDGLPEYKSLYTSAVFTLVFDEPLVVTVDVLEKIEQLTGFPPETGRRGRLLNLLLSKDNVTSLDSLHSFVILNDQSHMYTFRWESCRVEAVEVKKILWRNTQSLASVMEFVRALSMFNHVLSTCLRNIVEDLNAIAKKEWRCIYISFSALDDSIDCALEYEEGSFFTVQFFVLPQLNATVCLPSSLVESSGKDINAIAASVFSRFWSVPIAIRAVLKALLPSSTNEGASAQCNGDKWSNDSTVDPSSNKSSNNSDVRDFSIASFSCSTNNTMHEYTLSGKESGKGRVTAEERIKQLLDKADALLARATPGVYSCSLPNMLNLFKQVKVWKELIPPRLTVRKLPRPAKFVAASPVQEHCPIVAPPTPVVVCSQAAVSATEPNPKNRHFSSTSETLTELDELCQLSSSFTEGGRGAIALGSSEARIADSAANAGDSSIQNTIDCVIGSVKSTPSYTMGNAPFKNVASEGANLLASIRNFEFNVFGQQPYVGKGVADVVDHDHPNKKMKLSMETLNWKGDISSASIVSPSCAVGQGSSGPDAMGNWQTTQQQRDLCAVRGMLVTRGVRRRRSRKPLGNTSDRAMEMVLKELRKVERMARGAISRRPRKARRCASANVLMRSDTLTGPDESSKFTLKIRPAAGATQTPPTAVNAITSCMGNNQMPTLDTAAAPRLSTDDMLRKQLKAVAREMISDVQLAPLESTDFDSPSSSSLSLPGDGRRYSTPLKTVESSGRFPSTSSDVAKPSASCYQPAAIKAPKRKNSLDAVIGKLMDKVGTSPSERRVDHEENFGEVFGDSNVPCLKKSRPEGGDTAENVAQPSSSDISETANEGIKLVIKKSVIKMGASSKSSTRGKTGSPAKKPSPTMSHRAQSVSPPLLRTEHTIDPAVSRPPSSNKFELLKQKMQARKLKKQPMTEKAKTKARKSEKRSADMHTIGDQADRKMLERSEAKLSPTQLPAVFPGTEGIMFSRSLKNFKIPKIEDTSAKAPSSTTPSSSSSTTSASSATTPVVVQSVAQVPTSETTSVERPFNAQPPEEFAGPPGASLRSSPRKPFGSMLHQASVKPMLRNHVHPHSISPVAMPALPPRYRHGENVEVSPSLPIPRYVRRTLLPNPPTPASTTSPPLPLQRPVVTALQQPVLTTQPSAVVSPVALGSGGQVDHADAPSSIPNLKAAADPKETAPEESVQLLPSPDASALVIDVAPAAQENVESLTDGSDVLSPGLQIAIEECADNPATTKNNAADCDKVESAVV
ncbi:mediator of RNA polymerase II [Trichuris trichiura]|uniref:Mediator of RNA polymerase II n=1 Tax=Trichuris trichiura TaxID=36087 RepID=A0A077ZGE8_TRITR|nr:mediator of RNA polymerase II [Trichuris trichiura]